MNKRIYQPMNGWRLNRQKLLTDPKGTTYDPDALLTLKQVGEAAGLDPAGLRTRTNRGEIPSEKIGRDWLCRASWLYERFGL